MSLWPHWQQDFRTVWIPGVLMAGVYHPSEKAAVPFQSLSSWFRFDSACSTMSTILFFIEATVLNSATALDIASSALAVRGSMARKRPRCSFLSLK